MNLSPPPQDGDPIITEFKPVRGQWELNDDNIKRIDPESGHTILHNYCEYINTTPLEVYRYLIETKGFDVNTQDEYQETPLILALHYFTGGDIAVLTYLLTQKDINVNIKNYYGYTLLHIVSFKIIDLPIEIFKLLIETVGCDVNAQDADNDTPLHNVLGYFTPSDGVNATILHYLLSCKDVNGNIKGKDGYTILHTACRNINSLPLDIFKVLIETQCCDVNIQDGDNNIPIYYAFQFFNPNYGGETAVLTYLLNQNDIHAKHSNGHNLLHCACISNHYFSRDSVKLSAKYDTISCQIVEVIVERCIREVLNELTR
jgi:ankyrin repeat protein